MSDKPAESARPRDDPQWWELVHTLLAQWQEVWQADRSQYASEYSPEMVAAAEELFAHDMCDSWVYDDYTKAALAIMARHLGSSTRADSLRAELDRVRTALVARREQHRKSPAVNSWYCNNLQCQVCATFEIAIREVSYALHPEGEKT